MSYARLASLVSAVCLLSVNPSMRATSIAGQETSPPDALQRPLDQILDLNVRDGLVYYRALRSERGRLDRYAASLNVSAATYDAWSREHKMAFWINAYNAFVLQTVIDRYPIKGASKSYPPNSIRQIPGAFEQIKHRAAGRSVTLDEIEKTILPQFKEPRVYLALGARLGAAACEARPIRAIASRSNSTPFSSSSYRNARWSGSIGRQTRSRSRRS